MKALFRQLLAGITLAACAACAFAATGADELRAFVSGTKTAKGTFTQAMLRKNTPNQVTNASSGSFSFSKPGKFVWHYQKPYSQKIISDGKSLYLYDKDLNQVTIKKVGDAISASPASVLFGSASVDKHFLLKNDKTTGNIKWVTVLPKQRDTMFERIRIAMKNGAPDAMELYDSLGHLTVIRFKSFRRNVSVPSSEFKFTVPKGADVFKN